MTDPKSVTPPVLDDDNSRRFVSGGIQGVEIAVLVLLLLVMLGQMLYTLSYSRTLRESQDALICQWQVTTQLRNAANLERQAQREIINLAGNQDLSAEERKVQGRIALKNWLDALNQADADRAAVPLCPDPRNPD
jgi:hypothetical protein